MNGDMFVTGDDMLSHQVLDMIGTVVAVVNSMVMLQLHCQRTQQGWHQKCSIVLIA